MLSFINSRTQPIDTKSQPTIEEADKPKVKAKAKRKKAKVAKQLSDLGSIVEGRDNDEKKEEANNG